MTRRAASRPDPGGWRLSHQVRIWEIRVNEGKADPRNPGKKPRRSYTVRWVVGGQEHQNTFAHRALADSERAKLIGYQQRGAAFDVTSGLPEPLLRELNTRTWLEHMCQYIDTKWPSIAGTSRKSVAEALATVTPALVNADSANVPHAELRELVYNWVTVAPARKSGPAPVHLASTLKWLERHSIQLGEFDDRTRGPELTRRALDLLAVKLDGTAAAPNTVARKKAVFFNALEHAVELGFISANPINHVSWRAPKVVETVERQSVVNMIQGRRLLVAVGSRGEMGWRLVAFFGAMLYAGLRPAEVIGLRDTNLVEMPVTGWGEFLLSRSSPRSGTAWSDSGTSREDRGLKHRAAKDTREVPMHPELVAILRGHIDRFGFGPGGRLFTGPRRGQIDESTYLRIWQEARTIALTEAQAASPLVQRPYDLRHTAVSTWLNAGVPPTQVARWAGHSVAVLLKVYAKCIVGQDQSARNRIDDATIDPDDLPEQ